MRGPSEENEQVLLTPDIFKTPKLIFTETKRPKTTPVKKKQIDIKVDSIKKDLFKTKEKEIDDIVLERIDNLYGLIRNKTGSLGGGGSGGEIYGELTQYSFHKIVLKMIEICDLSSNSIFLDIGAGLGKPNFHTAIYPGCKMSLGIEIQGSRWWQSMNLLHTALNDPELSPDINRVFLAHANIMDMETLDPVTHVYSFNRGMPLKVMKSMANAFNKSKSANYFICFDPLKKLELYGFKLRLLDKSLSAKMHGSREGHLCYIYEKIKKQQESMSEVSVLRSFRRSWGKLTYPSNARYSPCVKHSSKYHEGLFAMVKGPKAYKTWVWNEIGLDRCTRRLRTRKL